MNVHHGIFRWVFAFSVGLLVSWWSYQWVTNPDRAARRAVEEGVVREARQILRAYVSKDGEIAFSDPLERVRAAGKVYIYPRGAGWEISGHYQRAGERRWHPFLMSLESGGVLKSLAVQDNDEEIARRAAADDRFTVSALR